jgi:hypothetical protein
MASVPNDKDWYTYTSPNDGAQNMLVSKWIGTNIAFGFGTFVAAQAAFIHSKRHQPLSVIAQDITTSKRKIKVPVGSNAATVYALGQTFTWLPRGSATSVTMTVIKLIGEKRPAASSTSSHTVYP